MTLPGATIVGQATLSATDCLCYFGFAIYRRGWAFLPAVVCFWLAFSQPQANRMWDELLSGEMSWLAAAGSLTIGLVPYAAILTGFLAALNLFALRLMGVARRRMVYEIDGNGMVARNGLGFALSFPCHNVTATRFTKRLMLLWMKPRGMRYVPLRAFSMEDVAGLKVLAGQCVPVRPRPDDSAPMTPAR